MSVLVAGTIAIDNIITPEEKQEQLLGGSAAYASLAASFFSGEVHLAGIIGRDFPQEHLDFLSSKGIGLDGVEHSEGESFTWTGEYFDDLNTRKTHKVALNVLENWEPKIPASAREAQFIVLANMSPDNQLQTLEQCTAPAFVVADTMDLWIEIARDRLHDVLKKIDLLVINESEAREFAGTNNLIQAGAILREKGPQYVVIKLGEHGSFLFGEDAHHFFSCAAFPLRQVHDPTGAGDTFLGSLIGYLHREKASQPSFEQLKKAVVYGSLIASFTCEAFSIKALENLSSEDIERRYKHFREYTAF